MGRVKGRPAPKQERGTSNGPSGRGGERPSVKRESLRGPEARQARRNAVGCGCVSRGRARAGRTCCGKNSAELLRDELPAGPCGNRGSPGPARSSLGQPEIGSGKQCCASVGLLCLFLWRRQRLAARAGARVRSTRARFGGRQGGAGSVTQCWQTNSRRGECRAGAPKGPGQRWKGDVPRTGEGAWCPPVWNSTRAGA